MRSERGEEGERRGGRGMREGRGSVEKEGG